MVNVADEEHRCSGGHLCIGAGASWSLQGRPHLRGDCPSRAGFASPPIRHAGTMGGNTPTARDRATRRGAEAAGCAVELRKGSATRRLQLNDFMSITEEPDGPGPVPQRCWCRCGLYRAAAADGNRRERTTKAKRNPTERRRPGRTAGLQDQQRFESTIGGIAHSTCVARRNRRVA